MKSDRAPISLRPRPSLADRLLPVSPAGTYGFLAIAALAVLTFWFVRLGWGRLAFVPGFIGFFGVLFRFRFGAAGVFLLVVTMMYLTELSERFLAHRGGKAVVLPGLALLTFVLAYYRMLALAVQAFPSPESYGRLWSRVRRLGAKLVVPSPTRRAAGAVAPAEPWTVPVWALGLLLLGLLAHGWLPEAYEIPEFEEFEVDPRIIRVAIFIWIAGIGMMMASALLGHLSWRRLGRREAGTYLRGVVWRWYGRELEAIERYTGRRTQF